MSPEQRLAARRLAERLRKPQELFTEGCTILLEAPSSSSLSSSSLSSSSAAASAAPPRQPDAATQLAAFRLFCEAQQIDAVYSNNYPDLGLAFPSDAMRQENQNKFMDVLDSAELVEQAILEMHKINVRLGLEAPDDDRMKAAYERADRADRVAHTACEEVVQDHHDGVEVKPVEVPPAEEASEFLPKLQASVESEAKEAKAEQAQLESALTALRKLLQFDRDVGFLSLKQELGASSTAESTANEPAAGEHRSSGNAEFKAQQWGSALGHYCEALAKGAPSESNAKTWSNVSATLIKLVRAKLLPKKTGLHEANHAAALGTQLAPTWAKGWWRRGEVARLQREYTAAHEHFSEAARLDPSSQVFVKAAAHTPEILAAADRKSRRQAVINSPSSLDFSAMMGGAAQAVPGIRMCGSDVSNESGGVVVSDKIEGCFEPVPVPTLLGVPLLVKRLPTPHHQQRTVPPPPCNHESCAVSLHVLTPKVDCKFPYKW